MQDVAGQQIMRASALCAVLGRDAGPLAAGVPDGELALAVGTATTSIGRRRYGHLKANSALLRAVAFTNAVTLAPAPMPAEPAAPVAALAAPTLIRPIRKGAPTELALF